MNDKQAMIEKLKRTWTAFGGLSEEEQHFLRDNIRSARWLSANGQWIKFERSLAVFDNTVVRLSPDFQLPAERWFYSPVTHKLSSWVTQPIRRTELIEIPDDDVPCVKKCIELHMQGKVDLGEFEFRNIKSGVLEHWIQPNGTIANGTLLDGVCGMRFCRKPAKERFVEYPITNEAGQYYCLIGEEVFDNVDNIPIHELPSIVGFAGVKYKIMGNMESSWTANLTYQYEDKEPAIPIAARFYIKGAL